MKSLSGIVLAILLCGIAPTYSYAEDSVISATGVNDGSSSPVAIPCTPLGGAERSQTGLSSSAVGLTGVGSSGPSVEPMCAGGGRVQIVRLPPRLVIKGTVNRVNVSKFTVKVKGKKAFQETQGEYWIDKDHAGHGGSAWKLKKGDPYKDSSLVLSIRTDGSPRSRMIAIAG